MEKYSSTNYANRTLNTDIFSPLFSFSVISSKMFRSSFWVFFLFFVLCLEIDSSNAIRPTRHLNQNNRRRLTRPYSPLSSAISSSSHASHSSASSSSSSASSSSSSSNSATIERHFTSIAEENSVHLDPNAIDTCPPPPSDMPDYKSIFCEAPQCRSDSECSPRELRRCCFNGCKFTCLMKMLPPPLVDWSETPNDHKKGLWMLDGRDDPSVETCTTTHFDSSDWEQPLLCPHGYTCHILDLGDVAKGIPNRGHCVKERHTHKTHAHGPVWHFRIRTGSTSNLGCTLDSHVYSNGAFFQYDRHPCTCEQGMITCTVARYKENTNGSTEDGASSP